MVKCMDLELTFHEVSDVTNPPPQFRMVTDCVFPLLEINQPSRLVQQWCALQKKMWIIN